MPLLARKYAGILGTLAMSVVLVRAAKEASGPVAALWTAVGVLVVFSVAGLVVGWLADSIVVGSVRTTIDEQLQSEMSGVPPNAESSRAP